jgi:ABC-type multidrug transport system permease subunit
MPNRFEQWTKRIYRPQKDKWKRPVLLILSMLIGIACGLASYIQIHYHWTNNGIWWVIGLFGLFSIIGLLVSIFCKDYWVALVLGRPNI